LSFLRFLFWGLSYSAGISCAVIYFIYYIMDRNRFLKNLLIMLVPFLIVITLLFLMELFEKTYPYLFNVLSVLTLCASSALVYVIPNFAHTAKSCASEKIMKFFFGITALVLFAAIITDVFISLRIQIKEIVLVLLAISILYSMIVFIFGKPSILLPSHAGRITKIIALVCLCLLPGFIFLDFFSHNIAFLNRIFSQKPYTLPVFYLFFNIMLLTRATGPSIKFTMQDNINQKFFKTYKISKREREIMRELIKGKTYKEIGASLFISLSTARTHVYSIYRKTGINNKVELIHLLKHYQTS
jgi:DNA-binding CsgD family transcriptional regulator